MAYCYKKISPFYCKLLLIVALSSVLLTVFSASAFAGTTIINASGDYKMSAYESPAVAKERAVANAMRAAAEQAGVYVESYSRVHNLQLTEDETSSLAIAMLEVLDRQFEQQVKTSGEVYIKATISCRINSDSI